MDVVVTREELRQALAAARRAGQRVGLVPTMGYLHAGHVALLEAARSRCAVLVATIFVNPTQFGPGEDLCSYPRDLDGDLAKCAAAGVDLVFAPPADEIYRPGHRTTVAVQEVAAPLCGASRPGHFAGVATVVLKLLHLVRPQLAVFGRKDYQQLLVIQQMVRDLDLDDIEILGVPTVREADGLALSSRNAYLSPEQRRQALALPHALDAASAAYATGTRDARQIEAVALGCLSAEPALRVDYLEVRDAADLSAVQDLDRPAVVAAAVFVGRTRLIDNRTLGA